MILNEKLLRLKTNKTYWIQELKANNRFIKYERKEAKSHSDQLQEINRRKHNISSASERNLTQAIHCASINSNCKIERDMQHSWSHSNLPNVKTAKVHRESHKNLIKRLKHNLNSKIISQLEESKSNKNEHPKSKLDKYIPLVGNENKGKEGCFNKTIDLQSNLTGDLYNGLETEKFVSLDCNDHESRTGCETQRRTYCIPTHNSKISYDFANSRDSFDSKKIYENKLSKRFLLEGKKRSQANSYMKEGKLLKSLKNNVNTMSTGIIQPYSKVLIDNNDTSTNLKLIIL